MRCPSWDQPWRFNGVSARSAILMRQRHRANSRQVLFQPAIVAMEVLELINATARKLAKGCLKGGEISFDRRDYHNRLRTSEIDAPNSVSVANCFASTQGLCSPIMAGFSQTPNTVVHVPLDTLQEGRRHYHD